MQTKIQKWGNSLAVRLPKHLAAESRMTEGTVVDIAVSGGALVVTAPAEVEYTLAGLLAGVTKRNRHAEADFGGPVGREAL